MIIRSSLILKETEKTQQLHNLYQITYDLDYSIII